MYMQLFQTYFRPGSNIQIIRINFLEHFGPPLPFPLCVNLCHSSVPPPVTVEVLDLSSL
jgi:hypothetical protein